MYGEPIKASELVNYISSQVSYTYYINEFPVNGIDNSAYVKMTGGFPASDWTTKKKPSFQVVVRGEGLNSVDAEGVVYDIYTLLHNNTNFTLDNSKKVVHCSADQSSPMYLGRDDNNRPLYSINFTLTTI